MSIDVEKMREQTEAFRESMERMVLVAARMAEAMKPLAERLRSLRR